MALKDSTKQIIKYLQANNTADYTAKDVAEILGLNARAVNGAFTAAIVNKEMGERVEAKVALDDESIVDVKFLKLNDLGMSYDVDAE